MVAIGPNFFYTVTLPVTLWFLDRGKRGTDRARTPCSSSMPATSYRQIDRAHRDFLPEQIELLANIVRLYRGEEPETVDGSERADGERFPDGAYADVPGLCKVATIAEIEAQGWSLNPGRYVGIAVGDEDDGDFAERLAELHDEFTSSVGRGGDVLRAKVDAAVRGILESVSEWRDGDAGEICRDRSLACDHSRSVHDGRRIRRSSASASTSTGIVECRSDRGLRS